MVARRAFASLSLLFLIACSSAPPDKTGADAAPSTASDDIDPAPATDPSAQPAPDPPEPFDPMKLHPLWTEHVGQLIGTNKNPIASMGMRGTDLGSTFERDGKLVFLFGDTLTADGTNPDRDSVAFGPLALPAGASIPDLEFVKTTSGRYLPLTLSGINLDTMNVPVEGVPVGDTTYVFFATGWNEAKHGYASSTLAHTNKLAFDELVVDHTVADADFVNVSVVQDGSTCHIYGTGAAYRKTAIHHATVDCTQLATRSAWQKDATPAVSISCGGELSVRKHPTLGIYLMTYNCDDPNHLGEWLHLAPTPAGPWSDGMKIFDLFDDGFGRFIHLKTSDVGFDDGLAPPDFEEKGGGDYAPYLIPQYFADEGNGVYSITYALSSWSPYAVHLMKTYLGGPKLTAASARPVKGAGLPKPSLGDATAWDNIGDEFDVTTEADGSQTINSYTAANGDATKGATWVNFTVDATTKELTFTVEGASYGARVVLWSDNEIVRSSHGRDSNDPLPVRWNLEEYAGKNVRLSIDDGSDQPWGFVVVRHLAFR